MDQPGNPAWAGHRRGDKIPRCLYMGSGKCSNVIGMMIINIFSTMVDRCPVPEPMRISAYVTPMWIGDICDHVDPHPWQDLADRFSAYLRLHHRSV